MGPENDSGSLVAATDISTTISFDEIEAISAGTHTRFIVDLARRIERLRAKAAKLAEAMAVAPAAANP